MTPDSFATHPLPPRDQLEAWREWYRPVFDVVQKNSLTDEFRAEILLWKLGGLAMSRTSAPPVDGARTKGHLKCDPIDHWVISYCTRGAHSAVTAGTALEVPAKVPTSGQTRNIPEWLGRQEELNTVDMRPFVRELLSDWMRLAGRPWTRHSGVCSATT